MSLGTGVGRRRGGGPGGATPDELAALSTVRATGAVDEGVVADLDPLVAAALRLARDEGVALGPVLDAVAASADLDRQLASDVEAAVAPARAVARSLVALPLLAVPVLGTVAGVDLVGFYLHDPVGRVLGLVVVLLLLVAAGWMRMLVAASPERTASPAAHRRTSGALVVGGVLVAAVGPAPVGVALVAAGAWRLWRPPAAPRSPLVAVVADLAAVGLAAGHGLPTALRRAADHLATATQDDDVEPVAAAVRALALGLVLRPGQAPTDDDPSIAPLPEVVRALAAAGAPGVTALRGLARRLREDRARAARSAAARLPARLTFPTALVLVPATVLAIGAPIVLQGLDGLTGT